MNEVSGSSSCLAASMVSGLLLVTGGAAHRYLVEQPNVPDSQSLPDKQPLSSIPFQIGTWRGVDLPMDERVIQVAGTDDHVSRRYVDEVSGQMVSLYVGYHRRVAAMLGHRPRVCYPVHGWMHGGTSQLALALQDGNRLTCLIHTFTRQMPVRHHIVVLNYYVFNGRPTHEWADFWGPKWRMPGSSSARASYVAQVQVSSTFVDVASRERAEAQVERFAAQVAPIVAAILPSANGESDSDR